MSSSGLGGCCACRPKCWSCWQWREEEEPVLAERLVALDKCLEKLSDLDRRLILARYVDRASAEQIAAMFSQSRRTLFRNLERVRRLLFECINRSVVLGGQA